MSEEDSPVTLDGHIVSLLVEEGNKGGKIATVKHGKTGLLVFLPDETPVGETVRVKLRLTGSDRRGMPLFEGLPAPDEYSEIWYDRPNDGRVAKVRMVTNWLGERKPVKVLLQKTPRTQEVSGGLFTDRHVVWGSSLTDSNVEEGELETIITQKETVVNEQLEWVEQSRRQESREVVIYPITDVTLSGSSLVQRNRLEVTYGDDWNISLQVTYQVAGEERTVSFIANWQDLPSWLQAHIQTMYPVCVCGRKRHESQTDGYTRCEVCRSEETCNRCGREFITIKIIDGEYVCQHCQPLVDLERIVHDKLSPAARAAIARQAQTLLQVTPIEKAIGEQLLENGYAFITEERTRQRLLQSRQGYRWYYFMPDGVYGAKFDANALLILSHIDKATGNALVEMVAWLIGGPKPSREEQDFFLRTQMKHEENVTPNFSAGHVEEINDWISNGKNAVAQFLRGSEPERLAAVQAAQQAEEALTNHHKVDELLREMRAALTADEQEYGHIPALAQAAVQKGQVFLEAQALVEKHLSTCPAPGCGKPLVNGQCDAEHNLDAIVWEYDRDGDKKNVPLARLLTQNDDLIAEVLIGGHSYYGYETGQVNRRFTPNNPTVREGESVFVWDSESPIGTVQVISPAQLGVVNDPRVIKLQREIEKLVWQRQGLEGEQMSIPYEAQEAQEAYDQALEEAVHRLGLGHRDWPIQKRRESATGLDGQIDWEKDQESRTQFMENVTRHVFEIPHLEERPHRDGTNLEYGPFQDVVSGEWLLVILSPHIGSNAQIDPQQPMLVRLQYRNGDQAPLFWKEMKVTRQDGRQVNRWVLAFYVHAYQEPSDQTYIERKRELNAELAKIDAELEKLKKRLATLQAKAEELKADRQVEAEDEPEVETSEPVAVTEDLAIQLAQALGGRVKGR